MSVTSIPDPLESAIVSASGTYHIPKDLLEGIWRVETGSHFPNPWANGLGYGGEFGTAVTAPFGSASDVKRVTEPPVQQQANLSASILAQNIRSHQGNISEALSAYSGGGYSSVPGETSFGTWNVPNNTPVYIDPGKSGGLVPPGIKNGVGGITNGITSGITSGFDWVKTYIMRGLLILLGTGVALMGLYLIARALGAPNVPVLANPLTKKLAPLPSSGSSPRPRAGDAAAARGEPVARTDAPQPVSRSDRRSLARNERGRQRAAGERKQARDRAYGGDDDIPF